MKNETKLMIGLIAVVIITLPLIVGECEETSNLRTGNTFFWKVAQTETKSDLTPEERVRWSEKLSPLLKIKIHHQDLLQGFSEKELKIIKKAWQGKHNHYLVPQDKINEGNIDSNRYNYLFPRALYLAEGKFFLIVDTGWRGKPCLKLSLPGTLTVSRSFRDRSKSVKNTEWNLAEYKLIVFGEDSLEGKCLEDSAELAEKVGVPEETIRRLNILEDFK